MGSSKSLCTIIDDLEMNFLVFTAQISQNSKFVHCDHQQNAECNFILRYKIPVNKVTQSTYTEF